MHDDAVRWLTDLISRVVTIISLQRGPSHRPLIARGGGSLALTAAVMTPTESPAPDLQAFSCHTPRKIMT
jgi:hypothetical protein